MHYSLIRGEGAQSETAHHIQNSVPTESAKYFSISLLKFSRKRLENADIITYAKYNVCKKCTNLVKFRGRIGKTDSMTFCQLFMFHDHFHFPGVPVSVGTLAHSLLFMKQTPQWPLLPEEVQAAGLSNEEESLAKSASLMIE